MGLHTLLRESLYFIFTFLHGFFIRRTDVVKHSIVSIHMDRRPWIRLFIAIFLEVKCLPLAKSIPTYNELKLI
jgi:hypothetical protein